MFLFTSTLQTSLISVYRVFEDFVVIGKLSTSTQEDSHKLSRKFAGMREDSTDKLPFCLDREARHCSPSLPHHILSAVSAHPDMLDHEEKAEGTLATESLSFPTHVSDTKKPTKQTHIKPNPDLHVKS